MTEASCFNFQNCLYSKHLCFFRKAMEVTLQHGLYILEGDFYVEINWGFASGSGLFISFKHAACGNCCRHRDRACVRLITA